MNKKFLALMLSICLCMASSITAFAEPISERSNITNAKEGLESPIEMIATITADGDISVQPYGSLSGYRNFNTRGLESGTFALSVNGSWSPVGGCTIKTYGFAADSRITVNVYDGSGNWKAGYANMLPTEERANLAMANVSPGNWGVKFNVTNPSAGTIHVWIY